MRIGSRAAVTRSRNQLSMAASMCPVMSNSPGEGWLPPLTAPPLPASGVLGAVVLPGPTWMPGGPSPEDPELDPDVIGVVVEAVLVDPEAWAAVNATPKAFVPGRWSASAP